MPARLTVTGYPPGRPAGAWHVQPPGLVVEEGVHELRDGRRGRWWLPVPPGSG